MDTYRIGRFLFELKKPDVLAEYRKDPEAMMNKYKLSQEEKSYITSKDPRAIFDAGIHPQLISQSSRTIGMDPITKYRPRAQSVSPESPVSKDASEEGIRQQLIREIEKDLNLQPRPSRST